MPRLSILSFLFLGCFGQSTDFAVNLGHLDALCEEIQLNGKCCTIVHIYADAPDYRWTDAAEEGVSCVDDVARAAVVYMRAAELGNGVDIDRVKGLLRFVMVMQADDGEFYNFIDRQGEINQTGVTSRKEFAFWAARGYWALGEGYAFFKSRQLGFADSLRTAFLRCKIPITAQLHHYGRFSMIDGRSYPDWLMLRHAGDATAELLLGFTAYLRVDRDSLLADFAVKLAEGVAAMQLDEPDELRGAFESWPGVWHAWGSSQVQALAALGEQLDDLRLKKAALQAAPFLSRLAVGHPAASYEFAARRFIVYPQIAYDIRPAALGLLALYRLSGDERFALLAGLSASWLFGLNVAGAAMYDPATGRVFDGIDPQGVNRNAGAESTLEGLMTLLEVTAAPKAARWLGARPLGPFHSFFLSKTVRNRLDTPSGRIEVEWRPAEQTVEVIVP